MKKLILVRHAKSSWEYDVIDHERPLKKRGFDDANLVSKYLSKEKLNVNLALSSDAVRAKTTAKIFIENLNIDQDKLHLVHELYDFSGENLSQTIKNCSDAVNTLMVFGHNHAITWFANTYGSYGIDNVPTSGVVVFQFDIKKWNELKPGKTITTLFPKNLR